ncbi:MAG: hypothetical protein AAF639_08575 [Chloroflexota bacterium]
MLSNVNTSVRRFFVGLALALSLVGAASVAIPAIESEVAQEPVENLIARGQDDWGG